MRIKFFVLATVLGFGSAMAGAQDVYLGAAFQLMNDDGFTDRQIQGGNLSLGWNIRPDWALELSVAQLDADAEQRGQDYRHGKSADIAEGTALKFWSITRDAKWYSRAGVRWLDTEYQRFASNAQPCQAHETQDGVFCRADDQETQLVLGAGLQYQFSSQFAVRAEWDALHQGGRLQLIYQF